MSQCQRCFGIGYLTEVDCDVPGGSTCDTCGGTGLTSSPFKPEKKNNSVIGLVIFALIFITIGAFFLNDEKEIIRMERIALWENDFSNGDAIAALNLGKYYQFDKKEIDTALKYYLFAANKGNISARTFAARIYTLNSNFQYALTLYRKNIKEGDTNSYVFLGFMYLRGQGVAQNSKAAIELMKKAEKLNASYASYSLGTIYFQGEKVNRDKEKAYNYFKKAALAGHKKASKTLEIACKKDPEICGRLKIRKN